MTPIHVGVTFDRNFLLPFYPFATSLFRNNRDVPFHIHCIAPDLAAAEQEAILSYVEQNDSAIPFYSIDEEFVSSFHVTPTRKFPPTPTKASCSLTA